MNKEQIFEKVKHILNNRGFNPVVYGAKFAEDLGMDSLDVVELLVEVEIEFNMAFDTNFFNRVDSVAKLCSYIHLTFKKYD